MPTRSAWLFSKVAPVGRPLLVSVIASVVVALAVLSTSCRRCGGKSDGKVKVQLDWVPEPEFGGVYAALVEGVYSRAGIDVAITPGTAGSPVVQLVASGGADFGVTGGEDVIVARSRGADVVAIFATFQTSPQGIMLHAARGVTTLRDLHDGTLAIETGSPFGTYLKKTYGFSGVTIVPYDGGVARFLADPTYAQQCFVTSEPIAAKKQGGDPQLFLGADLGFDPYANVIVTRGELLRSKPDLVRAFVQATAEGWRRYLNDPKPANDRMATLNGAMDRVTFDEVAAAQATLVKGKGEPAIGSMTKERWSKLATQLVDLAVIDAAPPIDSLFASP